MTDPVRQAERCPTCGSDCPLNNMLLPENAAYPGYRGPHLGDDWCKKLGCVQCCDPFHGEQKHEWNAVGDKPWTCKKCFFCTANLRHIENGFCRHSWIKREWDVCERCGVVKNDKNISKPCIGKVSIETREPSISKPDSKDKNEGHC